MDFRKKTILVRRTMPIHRQVNSPKTTSSRRTVAMSLQLAEALEAMLRRRREGVLRGWQAGDPGVAVLHGRRLSFGLQQVFQKLETDEAAAKVRRRRPHDLRHTYATLNLLAGKPLAYVSAQLGHRNPRNTLEVYSHWVKGANPGPADTLDEKIEISTKTATATATGDNRN